MNRPRNLKPTAGMMVWHQELGLGKIRTVEAGKLTIDFLFFAPAMIVKPDGVTVLNAKGVSVYAIYKDQDGAEQHVSQDSSGIGMRGVSG